ncbi:hypothetical protein DCM90_07115 [Levilactobacillus bambusae]|uniref:Uncharacterized protein n=2 Tax=Levilactobacillus bambusae TaxID=2024736 RepID=A0A2V1MXQ4_9LACO|nr:hypothetical protein DCM90_07115 [Levilactobacillus bambusae]
MIIQIPQDMDEVTLRQVQLQRSGVDMTEDEVIKQGVLDAFQQFLDQVEDGHYDTGVYEGHALVVKDIYGEDMGHVTPEGTTFIEDFKTNAESTLSRLEAAAIKIGGGR